MEQRSRLFVLTSSAKKSYASKVKNLFGSSLVAYWPLNETSGTDAIDASGNSRAGVYSGAVLASAAGPTVCGADMAPYFDGSNDFVNVYSLALNGISKAELTLAGWSKVNAAADWTDGAYKQIIDLRAIGYIFIRKSSSGNEINMNYNGKSIPCALTVTTWFHWAMVVSVAGDYLRAYINGAKVGADVTGLTAVTSTFYADQSTIAVYNSTTPQYPWRGYMSNVIILNRPALDAEIVNLYSGVFL